MSDDDVTPIPYQGDFYVKLSAVTDAKTGLAVTDAAVTVNLQTLGGQAVTGAQNIAAPYDTNTLAYWAVIPRTAGVQLGQQYRVQGIAAKGGLQVPFYQKILIQRFPA